MVVLVAEDGNWLHRDHLVVIFPKESLSEETCPGFGIWPPLLPPPPPPPAHCTYSESLLATAAAMAVISAKERVWKMILFDGHNSLTLVVFLGDLFFLPLEANG